jgi:hypothetical protein
MLSLTPRRPHLAPLPSRLAVLTLWRREETINKFLVVVGGHRVSSLRPPLLTQTLSPQGRNHRRTQHEVRAENSRAGRAHLMGKA